jgi:hypothetical protein
MTTPDKESLKPLSAENRALVAAQWPIPLPAGPDDVVSLRVTLLNRLLDAAREDGRASPPQDHACFECGHELHAPFCPACNPEMVGASPPPDPRVKREDVTCRYAEATCTFPECACVPALSPPPSEGVGEHEGLVEAAQDLLRTWGNDDGPAFTKSIFKRLLSALLRTGNPR